MKRPLWIEVLSYPLCIAFWWVVGTYFLVNCYATGNVVCWLVRFAFGATP